MRAEGGLLPPRRRVALFSTCRDAMIGIHHHTALGTVANGRITAPMVEIRTRDGHGSGHEYSLSRRRSRRCLLVHIASIRVLFGTAAGRVTVVLYNLRPHPAAPLVHGIRRAVMTRMHDGSPPPLHQPKTPVQEDGVSAPTAAAAHALPSDSDEPAVRHVLVSYDEFKQRRQLRQRVVAAFEKSTR
jgi:hypothetical protein